MLMVTLSCVLTLFAYMSQILRLFIDAANFWESSVMAGYIYISSSLISDLNHALQFHTILVISLTNHTLHATKNPFIHLWNFYEIE